MIVNIWEFQVKQEKESEFIEFNGPRGKWYEFFKRSQAFIETILLKDEEKIRGYLTQDFWKSIEDFQAYIKNNERVYYELSESNLELVTIRKHKGIFQIC